MERQYCLWRGSLHYYHQMRTFYATSSSIQKFEHFVKRMNSASLFKLYIFTGLTSIGNILHLQPAFSFSFSLFIDKEQKGGRKKKDYFFECSSSTSVPYLFIFFWISVIIKVPFFVLLNKLLLSRKERVQRKPNEGHIELSKILQIFMSILI